MGKIREILHSNFENPIIYGCEDNEEYPKVLKKAEQMLNEYFKGKLDDLENSIIEKEMPTTKDMPIIDVDKARVFYINDGWNTCRMVVKQKISELREE